MKASVFGIGTELVDGQIVNKNAAWISQKLKKMGLTTDIHLVVPDKRELMLEGLSFCAAKSNLIFVTGGLGPTSDDFTREVITAWAGKDLKFDERSWQHLSERLTSRGYAVKEIQRQQCYFPEGSQILSNSEGTANGFLVQHLGKNVFALPGPPREIEAVWNDHIQHWLTKNTPQLDRAITRTWQTLGVGESDIAVLVEEVLRDVDVQIGYRVHLPYVEVKLSHVHSRAASLEPAIQKLTDALAYCTVFRNSDDAVDLFSKLITEVSSLSVVDEVTGAFLMNRIQPALRHFMSHKDWNFAGSRDKLGNAELCLQLLPKDEHTCEVILEQRGRTLRDFILAPYRTANMRERRLQYFAEKALIFWVQNIR